MRFQALEIKLLECSIIEHRGQQGADRARQLSSGVLNYVAFYLSIPTTFGSMLRSGRVRTDARAL